MKLRASEALAADTVTKGKVYLKAKGSSTKVQAKAGYDVAKRQIVLTPSSDLAPATTYQVTVKGVEDLAGNRWDQKRLEAGARPLRYSFATA